MKNQWQKEYALRASDFDTYNRIKPSSVLDLFQDAAGQHGEEIGVGFAAMIARSYLWVLTRVKFRILSNPKAYQTVLIKTWPLEPNRLNYRREYRIESLEGEVLIIGSSEWVVIHSETRRLLAVPDLYDFSDGFRTEMMFEVRMGRARDFEAVGEPYTVKAGFSDLDRNGHVNNTKYAGYVLDAIDPSADAVLDTFQIDYRKEVLKGTDLHLFVTREEGAVLAKGQNDQGETMFSCKLEFRA